MIKKILILTSVLVVIVSVQAVSFAAWTGPTLTPPYGNVVVGATNQWTTSGNNIYNGNSANVGIGITNPTVKLQVASDAMVNLTLSRTNAGSGGNAINYLGGGASSQYNWQVGKNITTQGAFEFVPSTGLDGTSFTTPVAVILQSGRVGIGLTDPDANYKLTTTAGGIKAESTSQPAGYFNSSSGYGLIVNTGNVGIGTVAPSNSLDVYGANKVPTTGPNSTNLFIASTDVPEAIDKGGTLGFGGNINAGISTTQFAAIAGRKESGGSAQQAGYLAFFTNNSGIDFNERLRITSGGNVGIGTTAPNNTLQVKDLVNFDSARTSTYLGYLAGTAFTTGYQNVFVGYEAGKSNTTGDGNSFLGFQTGLLNVGGAQNTFIGTAAGKFNTSGHRNTFIGYNAGVQNTTGSHNLLLGWQTAFNLTTGSNNIIIGNESDGGSQTASNLTTGSDNIIIGRGVYATSATMTRGLNIGNLIFATGLDGTESTLSTGNVGIGTTNPATKFAVYSPNANAMPATSGSTQSIGLVTRIQAGSSGEVALDIGNNNVNGFWLQSLSPANLATNYPLLLNPNAGNVGIGTTAPAGIFQVGDLNTVDGGMIFKRIRPTSGTPYTYFTATTIARFTGKVDLVCVSDGDPNRQIAVSVRLAYPTATATVITTSSQNATAAWTTSGSNLQVNLTSAVPGTGYDCTLFLMGNTSSAGG